MTVFTPLGPFQTQGCGTRYPFYRRLQTHTRRIFRPQRKWS